MLVDYNDVKADLNRYKKELEAKDKVIAELRNQLAIATKSVWTKDNNNLSRVNCDGVGDNNGFFELTKDNNHEY